MIIWDPIPVKCENLEGDDVRPSLPQVKGASFHEEGEGVSLWAVHNDDTVHKRVSVSLGPYGMDYQLLSSSFSHFAHDRIEYRALLNMI